MLFRSTPFGVNHYWVYGLVLGDDVPFDAAKAMALLGGQKVGTRPFFWPMHEQPVFNRLGMFVGESCPVSERIARRGFYLPSGVALTEAQMNRAATALRSILG